MASESTRSQDETRTIIIDGQALRIAIRSGEGNRTPLLLINGIGINLEVLQPFVDALDTAIEVIRFDVPGTGGSPAPTIPYRFSALARLVAQMLNQLGYQQVDVLGVSWGWGRVHRNLRRSSTSFFQPRLLPDRRSHESDKAA